MQINCLFVCAGCAHVPQGCAGNIRSEGRGTAVERVAEELRSRTCQGLRVWPLSEQELGGEVQIYTLSNNYDGKQRRTI